MNMTDNAVEEVDFANSTISFPHKLFILVESGEYIDLICWASHGMCFRIIDADKFAEGVVPKYFKQTKLTSFQRQLNLYGFRRLSKGEDQGCYFHPKFQRNRKDLIAEIKRLPPKGSLQTYDQVMAALNSRPSERFAAKRKQSFPEDGVIKKRSGEGIGSSSPNSIKDFDGEIIKPIGSGLVSTSNPSFPRMSRLTLNIGYHKFIENQQKNLNSKQSIAPPRAEHVLRSYIQQSQPPTPVDVDPLLQLNFSEKEAELEFPISSNFASESLQGGSRSISLKSFDELSFVDYDREFLEILEPFRVDGELDANFTLATSSEHAVANAEIENISKTDEFIPFLL